MIMEFKHREHLQHIIVLFYFSLLDFNQETWQLSNYLTWRGGFEMSDRQIKGNWDVKVTHFMHIFMPSSHFAIGQSDLFFRHASILPGGIEQLLQLNHPKIMQLKIDWWICIQPSRYVHELAFNDIIKYILTSLVDITISKIFRICISQIVKKFWILNKYLHLLL